MSQSNSRFLQLQNLVKTHLGLLGADSFLNDCVRSDGAHGAYDDSFRDEAVHESHCQCQGY